ncbi:MAG TPA: hypothetical protein VFG97_07460, partial [Pedococcus sp.]|nr:hypothetical protein [Pedococcus sp.]
LAGKQWRLLREALAGLGHTVHALDPEPGLPDMVFAANGAFSVDGVVVELGGGQGEIILGHTTCGEPIDRQTGRAPTPPRAEAPEPVRQSVPVTG